MLHTPVLKNETVALLEVSDGKTYIDCTCGTGGHAQAILEECATCKLVCIDWDKDNLKKAKQHLKKYKKRVLFIHDNYRNLEKIVSKNKIENIFGILLDLGMSSPHLESGRGFSFKKNEALDMRYDNDNPMTALTIINTYQEKDLADIFKRFGEERYARNIAKRIVKARKEKEIKTTFDLVDVVRHAVPQKVLHGRTHFAAKVFQALRIKVNDELINIETVLPQAVSVLEKNGIIAVITFHSLEDRIVKKFFCKESSKCLCPPELPICKCGHKQVLQIMTKKALIPADAEIMANPRARSARLRAAKKK